MRTVEILPIERSREDGLCVNCKTEPATIDWVGDGGTLAYMHGHYYRWCKRCVLTEQIKNCRKAADRLPVLEAELAALPHA